MVGSLILVYILVVVGLNLPFVRNRISSHVSELVSKKLGTEVRLENTLITPFNRIVLKNVVINDQNGRPMLRTNHLGARIVLSELFHGRLVIDNLEFFNTQLSFYKTNQKARPNYQFVLDSLKSKHPEQKGLEFIVKTLIVRDLSLKYDVRSEAAKNNTFDLNHLYVKNFQANLRLNHIGRDSLNIRVRHVQFNEQNGLEVKHLAGRLLAGPCQTRLLGFKLETPYSTVKISDVLARNAGKNHQSLDFLHLNFNDLNLTANILPFEFAAFCPALKKFQARSYRMVLNASKNGGTISGNVSIQNKNKQEPFLLKSLYSFDLYALLKGNLNVNADIPALKISPEQVQLIAGIVDNLPPAKLSILSRLGTIDHQGQAEWIGRSVHWSGTTTTGLGSVTTSARINTSSHRIEADVMLKQFGLGRLLDNEKLFGTIDGRMNVSGLLNPLDLRFLSNLNNLTLNGYDYKNFNLNGTCQNKILNGQLSLNDNNASLRADFNFNPSRSVQSLEANANIARLNPHALHLTNAIGTGSVSGRVMAHLTGPFSSPAGKVSVYNLTVARDSLNHSFDSLIVDVHKAGGHTRCDVLSDMADVHLSGNVELHELPEAVSAALENRMPILRKYLPHSQTNKYAHFDIRVKNSRFFEDIFSLPFRLEDESFVTGNLNTSEGSINLTASLPRFTLLDSPYSDGTIFLTNKNDSLSLLAQVTKKISGDDVKFVLNSQGLNNIVLSNLEWKALNAGGTHGGLKTLSSFSTEENGNTNTHIHLYPSKIYVNDSIWNISSSSFDLRPGLYRINDFILSHNKQYLSLHSTPPEIAGGKGLVADLKDIDLDYVFYLLNFHPVRFEGKASGRVLTGNLSETQDFNARLVVENFKFNTGPFGTLWLDGKWDNAQKKVLIDAVTHRGQDDSTLIRGHVDVGQGAIDLHFQSEKTTLQLLNEYLDGIFTDLDGTCTGWLRLYGPLSGMNLEGDEKINFLNLNPKPLNTGFRIENDSVHFRTGKILFNNLTMRDKYGHEGKVNGQVSHERLRNFKYDFHFDTDNLLVYNWNQDETTGFWGTIFADGNCRLWGSTDDVHVDMDITPQKNSVFVYDSSSPDNAGTNEFIRFKDPNEPFVADVERDSVNSQKALFRQDNTTDTYLNFNINATPDANFVILTDKKSGDRMTLYGSGPLHATYYNKGKFLIYGTYTLDHGQYNITIKDIIHKNFNMKQGGTLRFNGTPDDGDLNMQGVYTVNSVSLSDLNLGNLSNSNATVDCILNFKGKAGSPEVSFDIDFPSVNDDEAQMVRNMIASQGDMNMQIIYLLSIGRFFTYDYSNFNSGSNQDQSTVAMKSLLANTLSGQINNMISNAFHVTNWTFGTNLATGRMGWSDMEVEGLLSGSLLNNRLLINGNFGYRDQTTYYSNDFVGDFNLRWLLNKSGTISLKAYSETNDRYFTRSSLVTNGAGILFQRDFDNIGSFFKSKKKEKNSGSKKNRTTRVRTDKPSAGK